MDTKRDPIDEFILIRNVTLLTILINIFLSLIKFFGGVYANSTALLADALHSASDIITSAGVIIGVFISKKPKDDCHPFGHGKAESITGFLLSLLLLFVGINIGYKGIRAFIQWDFKEPKSFALWVAIISIFLKELQFRISYRVGKRLNSSPVIADAWHHRSDALSSIGVLLGIIGAKMGFLFLDPLVAFFISVIIIKISLSLLKETLSELMDASLPSKKLDKIKKAILDTPYVLSIEDIKSRKNSNYLFLNISIIVDPSHSLQHSHIIAHEVEDNIKNAIEYQADIHVHVEPEKIGKLNM